MFELPAMIALGLMGSCLGIVMLMFGFGIYEEMRNHG